VQAERNDARRQLREFRADCRSREQELDRLRSSFGGRENELLAPIKAWDRGVIEVREAFSRDLEKQREAAKRAQELLRASEKRAVLEIDRKRQSTGQ
jgi:hypothetical protein